MFFDPAESSAEVLNSTIDLHTSFFYTFAIGAFDWYTVGELVGIFADNDSSGLSVDFLPKLIFDAIFNMNHQKAKYDI